MAQKPKIYIDGEAGTTGLQIATRLADRSDITLIRLGEKRKDLAARTTAMNEADLVILCLPDEAAKEAVTLVTNPSTKILDASTAHRTHADWVYGFPELHRCGQARLIKSATRLSNPGCHAIGAISLLAPLVAEQWLRPEETITLHSISGYSGGGKAMIAEFEDEQAVGYNPHHFHLYGLNLAHKHLPEIQKYSGLMKLPLFLPSVASFPQGMAVILPLAFDRLAKDVTPHHLAELYQDYYQPASASQGGNDWQSSVRVATIDYRADEPRLYPERMAGRDDLAIHIRLNSASQQGVVIALFDNLGKGAAGQAVQNLEIMLGLPPLAK